MIRKPLIAALWIIALAIFVLLSGANLYWGDLNQDEGWYLYAARQVQEGRLPFRDFAFTQGPMLPLVYARAQVLVDRFGVAGGRLFTALLAFFAAIGSSWLASRAAPVRWRSTAALLTFLLIAANVYQSYFTTVVKTYSLCSLFLVGGLLAAGFAGSRGGVYAGFLSGLLLALAAGTRISAGISMPVVGLYLLLSRKALGDSRWISFGAGGLLGLLGMAIPFAVLAPAGFRFGMLDYHTFRSAGGLVPALVYKAGFISRFVQAYYLASALGVVVALLRLLRPVAHAPEGAAPPRFNAMLWTAAMAVSMVHFSAPFPYEDYQACVFPVFAAALAVSLVRYVAAAVGGAEEGAGTAGPAGRWATLLVLSILLLSVASAFSSPINQGWFLRERDRIWWRLKEQSSLQQLRDVAAWVRDQAGDSRLLLTQDTYLAVEAGLDVPPGMEMGPFSYFPEMNRQEASALRVLNREMLIELLSTTDARAAAFSGYGLSIQCPEVVEIPVKEQEMLWQIVARRYEAIREVPGFGQGPTTLRIFRKKENLDIPRP